MILVSYCGACLKKLVTREREREMNIHTHTATNLDKHTHVHKRTHNHTCKETHLKDELTLTLTFSSQVRK